VFIFCDGCTLNVPDMHLGNVCVVSHS
jgi:hypothetical protein